MMHSAISRSGVVSELFGSYRHHQSVKPVTKNLRSSRKTTILSCLKDDSTRFFDFIVIGSGVAGLRYALEVAKHGTVAVITKAEPHESNTNYAQGGVSAVLCPSDSVESHMRDTIVAGAYLCDEKTVRVSFLTYKLSNYSTFVFRCYLCKLISDVFQAAVYIFA